MTTEGCVRYMVADAVVAIVVAARAARQRWGLETLPAWWFASRVSQGCLLAPPEPALGQLPEPPSQG